jgi:hypothetical protein
MEGDALTPGTIAEIHRRMRARVKRPDSAVKVFAVGDFVRVALTTESSIRKLTFRKRIMNNYSDIVYQVYSVSAPEAVSAQPQYLLYNTTTKRKSIKKYWSYQLILVNEPDEIEKEESEEVDLIPAVPEARVAIPARQRVSRDRAPSAQALENVVQDSYW